MTAPLPDGPIDTLGFLDAVLAMPEQVEQAGMDPVAGLPAITDIDHVIVSAGAGLAPLGDLVTTLVSSVATIPVIAVRGAFPAFVGPRSLVLSVGDVADASVDDRSSTAAGATFVSLPVAHVESLERTGLAGALVSVLRALEQLGQYAEVESSVAAAAAQLRRRRDELTGPDSPARRLARRVGRTLPLVYGPDPLGGAVAARWKQQVNLGAKAASFANALPDLGDDELAGWGQHGDMTRQVFSLVELRHDHEPAGTDGPMARVADLLDEVVHERHVVAAEGEGVLAQVLDLVFYGDVFSHHLAQELEIDPGPVAVWSEA
ncbi:SIS domain-containing protein [Actinospongicola halichondriae]|uniref:SIS domain-containing protein n=1 Tax=Actinospongicola halichondriae TaxID=3236844 RepID=UPI003D507CF2